MKFWPSIFLLFLTPLFTSAQKTWFVQQSASGANTGQNWPNAFTNLHSGLAVAQPGDAIWVAAGEYRPDSGFNRNQYFELKSGVRLYGSFAGTETSLEQRPLGIISTTLSGNIGNPADSTDNSYTILYMAYPNAGTLVNGFTFRHGYARTDTSFLGFTPILNGGAVFIRANDSIALPTFEHCIFRDNLAKKNGGAIYIRGQQTTACTPVFRYCEFFNNRALQNGGAICWTGGSPLDRGIEFDHCRFVRNTALYEGGAIFYEQVSGAEMINFKNCLITDNVGYRRAGFFAMAGLTDIRWRVHFDSCVMARNQAYAEGGSIFSMTTSIAQNYYFKVSNCDISENLPSQDCSTGCGLFVMEPRYDAAGRDTVIFSNNFSHHNKFDGTLIGTSGHYCLMENNIIENNRIGGIKTILEQRAISIIRNNILRNNEKGGAIDICQYAGPSQVRGYVYNNIVEGQDVADTFKTTSLILNHLRNGAHMARKDTIYCFNNLFLNNRFWNNPNQYSEANTNAVYNFNNIYLNNLNAFDGKIGIPQHLGGDSIQYFAHNLMDVACTSQWPRTICGPGNVLATDALFKDALAGDFRLQPCSPAINAGTNLPLETFGVFQDYAGQPRIQEETVDIGPHESLPFSLSVLPQVKAACHGISDGQAIFDLVNGCNPLQYQWSNDTASGTKLNDLSPGKYTFTITDAQKRSFVTTLIVPDSSPEVVLTGDTVTCAGNNDGLLQAQLTNGASPATYNWSTSVSGSQITNLAIGIYTVTATDALGCTDTSIAAISDAPVPAIDSLIQNATSPTESNGSITVFVNAGVGPYRYKWSTGDTISTATNLLPGQYTLSVTDKEGCVYTYFFKVGFSTGVYEAGSVLDLSVLPNPADSRVQVRSAVDGHWLLLAPDGQVLRHMDITAGSLYDIPTDALLPSVYFYWFSTTDGRTQPGRLIIIHH